MKLNKTTFALFVTTMTIDSEFDGATAASVSVLDAVDRSQTRKVQVKNGKKAGNTGLTQANDAETTCNTAASDFCDEVTIDEGGRAQAACYDSQKYDSKKTPPCPLYTSVDYICNTAASDFCDEVTKDEGGRAFAACYDYQKYDSKKTPPCPLYTSVDYICNTAAWDYCKDDDAAPADCYDYQKYDSKKAPPCPVLPPKRD